MKMAMVALLVAMPVYAATDPCAVAKTLQASKEQTEQLENAHVEALTKVNDAMSTNIDKSKATGEAEKAAADYKKDKLDPANKKKEQADAKVKSAPKPVPPATTSPEADAAQKEADAAGKEAEAAQKEYGELKKKADAAKTDLESFQKGTLEPARKAETSAKNKRFAAVDSLLDDVRERGVLANKCEDGTWTGLSATAMKNMGNWNANTTALKKALRGQEGDLAKRLDNPIDALFNGAPKAKEASKEEPGLFNKAINLGEQAIDTTVTTVKTAAKKVAQWEGTFIEDMKDAGGLLVDGIQQNFRNMKALGTEMIDSTISLGTSIKDFLTGGGKQ